MTYGDGATTFQPLVSVDVAGHEMSHGVMSTEANLTYSGESGGLNESNSDIFGTLVEFSVTASPDVPDYWIGERIYKSNWSGTTFTQTKALRYMDDPKKDGVSPACWSTNYAGARKAAVDAATNLAAQSGSGIGAADVAAVGAAFAAIDVN